MPDVDQIVELGAIADRGDAQSRAIDAGIRADLDIIADLDAADLREFFVMVAGAHESKSVRAQHAAGMEDGAIADSDVVIDSHVGMQQAIRADADAVSDGASGAQARSFSDECTAPTIV